MYWEDKFVLKTRWKRLPLKKTFQVWVFIDHPSNPSNFTLRSPTYTLYNHNELSCPSYNIKKPTNMVNIKRIMMTCMTLAPAIKNCMVTSALSIPPVARIGKPGRLWAGKLTTVLQVGECLCNSAWLSSYRRPLLSQKRPWVPLASQRCRSPISRNSCGNIIWPR